MERAFEWLYRRMGPRYFRAYMAFELVSASVVCLSTVALLRLWQDMSGAEFVRIALVAEACVLFSLGWEMVRVSRAARPLTEWACGERGRERAVTAWRTAVGLPRQLVTRSSWRPAVFVALPVSLFITIELDLPTYSMAPLVAGTLVAIAYSAVLHFFVSEQALRPVVRDINPHLPAEFDGSHVGVPLRLKMLGSLPLINVITAVVVSGLSTNAGASVEDLGIAVIVAVIVAFTLSFELTALVTKSILTPVGELLGATERVRSGDFSTRVPVMSGDELGRLTRSFNAMVSGLDERERLREAFGSYVDPEVAERVVEEGALLEGEDAEVTVLFCDIRDFTAFAERASAEETVALLNDFYGLVVPILTRHGGHANKFLADGLLGVFGVPERRPDHADRALAAACEIASRVEEFYGDRLRVGVGINSGPVSAGTVGGGGRLEFTVIGDPVNVAARVEEVTRQTGDVVLLTEATRCLLRHTDRDLEPRGSIPLKGRAEPVPIYAAPGLGAADAAERAAERERAVERERPTEREPAAARDPGERVFQ